MRKASSRHDPVRNSPRSLVTISELVQGHLRGLGGGGSWSEGREEGGTAAFASSALRFSSEGDPRPIDLSAVGSHHEIATTHLGEPPPQPPTLPPPQITGPWPHHWGQRQGAPQQRPQLGES